MALVELLAQRVALVERHRPVRQELRGRGRRAGRRGKHNTAKQELPPQFAKAIDAAAMRGGATDSDAYLSDWRKGETMAASADIDTVLARLITDYPSERLARLVANGGYDRDPKE